MKTFKLSEPITVDGETFSELKLRKPKGRDMRLMPTDTENVGTMYPFLASICDIPETVIDAMDGGDVMRLMREATTFLSSAPTASTPSSGGN